MEKRNVVFENVRGIEYIKINTTVGTVFKKCEIKEISFTDAINTSFLECDFPTEGRSKISLLSSVGTLIDTCNIIGGERPIQTATDFKIINSLFTNCVDSAVGSFMENAIINNNTFKDCEQSVIIGNESLKNVVCLDNIHINTPEINKGINTEDSVVVRNIIFNE